MKTINDLTPQAYPEKYSQNIFTKGNKAYDLELEKVISKIKSEKAKLVLLQFPDGLKPYATAVVDYLEEKLAPKGVPPDMQDGIFGGKFLIWLGDCFGACDTPVLGKDLEKQIDLVIQFGHNQMMPSY
ncbi:hypothetical protein KAT80_02595 [Candidatus Pacearchaeota archaeon]|nr:hypothetical protein [Candidatus Pacearchaeota archaeon]